MRNLPERKRPVHRVIILPNRPTIVFVTVCTHKRLRCLASEQAHALLNDVWLKADSWQVGRYVVMPDHVHLFAAPTNPDVDLERWVRYWKSLFSRPYQKQMPIFRWQSGYWDTTLRWFDSYDQKWEYVRLNPVRHGLVQNPQDWPYQGELNVLAWF